MSDERKTSEALGIAVEMERKGMAFYNEAVTRTSNPFAQEMFRSLANDEKKHERVFLQMAEETGVRPSELDEMDPAGPIRRIQAIFKNAAAGIRGQATDQGNDIKVIQIAKGMEQEAFHFYASAAGNAEDALEKEAFEKIARQENEHWRILDDTQLYLTDPAKWHLKEENPLIDGG